MNEKIAVPYVLALINGYTDSRAPTVIGNLTNLGLRFEQNSNSQWEMIIERRQDFENLANPTYIFDLGISGILRFVRINVINIFDNDPIVYYQNPCKIPVSFFI